MIHIDSKNSITSLSEIDIKNLKDTLYDKLSKLEDIDTTRYQKEYLQIAYLNDPKIKKVIEESSIMNKFYVLTLFLAQKIEKDNNNITITIFDVLRILNETKDNTIIFNNDNIRIIGLFIIKCFREFNDKLKISKEFDFISILKSNFVIDDNKTKLQCDLFYEDQPSTQLEKSLKKDMKIIYDQIIKCNKKARIKYENNKKKVKPSFPEALKKLWNAAKIIKKITFELPKSNEIIDVYLYLIVLLNYEWFFSDYKSIKLDLQISYINSMDFYIKRKQFDKGNIYSYQTYQDITIANIVDDHIKIFEIMMFLPLFTSAFSQNESGSFEIIIPETYTYELIYILKTKDLCPQDFNILHYIDKQYHKLSIALNSLNSVAFHRLFLAINNNKIQTFEIDLFPEDSYYSLYSLHKCFLESNPIEQHQFNTTITLDTTELIAGQLFASFQTDLVSFLHLIDRKFYHFREINFKCDLPGIFFLNDKFINSIQKFFLNIFKIISISNNQNNCEVFMIRSSNFILETRRYPEINTFIEQNINLTKITKLNEIHLEIKFHGIKTLYLLIPQCVEKLYLGEIDYETFRFFIDKFADFSMIKEIYFTFDCLIYDTRISNQAKIFNTFIECEKSNTLKHIQMNINFYLGKEYLNMFIKSIKKANCQHSPINYHFILTNTPSEDKKCTYYHRNNKTEIKSLAFILKKRHGFKNHTKILKTFYSYLSEIIIDYK